MAIRVSIRSAIRSNERARSPISSLRVECALPRGRPGRTGLPLGGGSSQGRGQVDGESVAEQGDDQQDRPVIGQDPPGIELRLDHEDEPVAAVLGGVNEYPVATRPVRRSRGGRRSGQECRTILAVDEVAAAGIGQVVQPRGVILVEPPQMRSNCSAPPSL